MPRLDGVDISHHQADAGPVNLATVRKIPTTWFACKATQSTRYLDPTFLRFRTQAAALDFRCVGLYHWLSSTADPVAQASWFLSSTDGLNIGEFAMLDAEEAGITAGMCLAWCEAVEAFTRRPCAVYTGAYVAGGTIWQSTKIRTSRYGARPMILAAYTTEAKAKALPGVNAYPWSSWQYSSNGPVPGITGRCDMNQVDDWPVYDAACGHTAPPPHPEVIDPTPPPSSTAAVSYEEEAMSWVADSATCGSAVVTPVVLADNTGSYLMSGIDGDYRAMLIEGGAKVVAWPDDVYQIRAAKASKPAGSV